MTRIEDMKVEAVYWVRRYADLQAVKHESGRIGLVKEFEHQGFYVGDRYIIIPTYLVGFPAATCHVHDGHELCQHYVAEDELESWPSPPRAGSADSVDRAA